MRFRPANISLINRRLYLPRLRLILSSIEKDDLRLLTGHYISMSGMPTIRKPSKMDCRVHLIRRAVIGEIKNLNKPEVAIGLDANVFPGD